MLNLRYVSTRDDETLFDIATTSDALPPNIASVIDSVVCGAYPRSTTTIPPHGTIIRRLFVSGDLQAHKVNNPNNYREVEFLLYLWQGSSERDLINYFENQ